MKYIFIPLVLGLYIITFSIFSLIKWIVLFLWDFKIYSLKEISMPYFELDIPETNKTVHFFEVPLKKSIPIIIKELKELNKI